MHTSEVVPHYLLILHLHAQALRKPAHANANQARRKKKKKKKEMMAIQVVEMLHAPVMCLLKGIIILSHAFLHLAARSAINHYGYITGLQFATCCIFSPAPW